MAGVSGLGVLYLIARSIQIDCNHGILGENAIPLNTCYNQSSLNGAYHSYEYQCMTSSNNAIYRVDYTNHNCNDNNADSQRVYPIFNGVTPYECTLMPSRPCLPNQYAVIGKVNRITGEREEKGIMINKCISSINASRYIQCNQKQELQTWIFDDTACAHFDEVVTHSLDDWYEEKDAILQSIHCPYCDLSSISHYNTPQAQPNIKIDYVTIDDESYLFPEPLHICNAFRDSHASYKYQCIRDTVYRAIWNHSSTCSGLYDVVVPLTDVIIDANCLNYRTNIWDYSEAIQPSYVTLTRYTHDSLDNVENSQNTESEAREISYITNYCIRQNDETYIIIECQEDVMVIHYYHDMRCTQEISECMTLWQSNSNNWINPFYVEEIKACVGAMRTAPNRDIPHETHSEVLGIDTEDAATYNVSDVVCNYIHIHKYKEALNKCNPYSLFGSKHSYKFICGWHGNKRKIKKRKWKNKLRCDSDGDTYDEEEEIQDHILIDYQCDYRDIDVDIVEANCFKNRDYWQQTSIILNSCIKINDDRNSLYIRCHPAFTLTYYYHNNDCTFFDRKEKWYGNNCESRYSEFLLDCNGLNNDTFTTYVPTSIDAIYNPSVSPVTENPSVPLGTESPTSVYDHATHAPTHNPSVSVSHVTGNPSVPLGTESPTPVYRHPTHAPTGMDSGPGPVLGLDPTHSPSVSLTTANPSISSVIQNPTIVRSVYPSETPTQGPITHIPTFTPSQIPTVAIGNPSQSPTRTSTPNPTAGPITHIPTVTAGKPSQSPTRTPTQNPTQSPRWVPSSIPTILPSSDPVTVSPSMMLVFPTTAPSSPMPKPTPQHPTLEPWITTSSPTATPQSLELYLYLNETRSSYWGSTTQTMSEYGELIRRAVFLGLKHVTGHSMHYADKDVYKEKTWQFGGITDWRNCYLFDEKLLQYTTCPSISSLNPRREGAQFTAVAELYVVSDANTTGFKEYIAQQLESQAMIDYVRVLLDGIVTAETPPGRRLLSIAIQETIVISLYVLDPTKLVMPPPTKRPSITVSSTMTKPTRPTWSKVTDNAFIHPVPLPYQGLFINEPAVSGDIFVICVIILTGMIVLVGCCMWFKKRC